LIIFPDFEHKRFVAFLLDHHLQHRKKRPWRTLFQQSKDPYVIWVAEVMLQQTTIEAVIPKYIRFMERFATVQQLGCASAADLRPYIVGLGYYRRFGWMHENAQRLMKYQQAFPSSYEQLIQWKGIGPYTAASIASICFKQPCAVVDGNVKRVMIRLYDLRVDLKYSQLTTALQAHLNSIIPNVQPGCFNEALMELGQSICIKKPHCSMCPIKSLCLANKRKTQALNPAPSERRKQTLVYMHMTIYVQSSHLYIEKRTSDVPLLANTYGFPFTVCKQQHVSRLSEESKHIGCFKHAITHHKIMVHVYFKDLSRYKGHAKSSQLIKIPYKTFKDYCVSSLDHKALKCVIKHQNVSLS